VNVQKSLVFCFFVSIVNFGCTGNKTQGTSFQACNDEWFLQVEKKIFTGDGQGHGPDIGSLEWRSVIEFKLGIRDDSKVPPFESSQWCDYINKNFITDI